MIGLAYCILFVIILSCGISIANAQTVSRQANLSWTAPTVCADGSTITNCVVTGYIVQKQNGTAWDEIGTTAATVRTYVDGNLPLGTYTYRVLANSANGPSAPSASASKTLAVPGTPGALVVTITVTVQ